MEPKLSLTELQNMRHAWTAQAEAENIPDACALIAKELGTDTAIGLRVYRIFERTYLYGVINLAYWKRDGLWSETAADFQTNEVLFITITPKDGDIWTGKVVMNWEQGPHPFTIENLFVPGEWWNALRVQLEHVQKLQDERYENSERMAAAELAKTLLIGENV